MSKPRIGVYPGTFDPITKGHMDIIQRATRIVDQLVVAVARNDGKGPLFSTDERVELVRADVAPLVAQGISIEVRSFDVLLMHFAASVGATTVVRGLRAVSDFEYEFQMALMNRQLWDELETVFLPPDVSHSYLSASLVREIASLGGDVRPFVSPVVHDVLARHYPTIARFK